MKKIISIVVLLAMCVALFAGCAQEPASSVPAENPLDLAKTYLHNMYKGTAGKDEANKAVKDFTVVTAVAIEGVSFPVEWAVEITAGAEDSVKIADGDNGAKVVDINEKPEEQVDFTLTGTVKDAEGKTQSVSFKYYVPAVEKTVETGLTVVSEPKVGVPYKFGMLQGNLGQTLFITGNTANKDYYLETTDAAASAVDVYLETVEGGYKLYFKNGDAKTYIDVYQSGDYVNIRLTTEPTAVFTWNAEYKTLVTTVADEQYYMGTYKEYNTLSASKLSYATTSFPANLYEGGAAATPEEVDAPVVDTAYKFGMFQGNLGQTLYITGNTANKDYYLETTDAVASAVDVYLEAVEGGYKLYFKNGDAKTYIDVYQSGDYVNIRLTTEPTAVFTWNAEYKTLVTTVADEQYYMGTYKEYNTLSASKLSYAATSFPATFYQVG